MDLAISAVAKSFPGVRALDGVTTEFRGGEIHALMGENGAGKSTLIKIVTGVHRPDSGQVMLDRQAVKFRSPRDALAAGIGAVHQERNLVPRFSVGENVLLERLPARRGLVDYAAVKREARRLLAELDASIDTDVEVRRLSVAKMQLVEIAKALSLQAKVLLLDEPTASITDHEAAALFAVLRRLRDQGVAIVFVSHKLGEVLSLCDRVSVLRDGAMVASRIETASLSRHDLTTLMIGREPSTSSATPRRMDFGEAALRLEGVATSFGHREVGFTLDRGEILGLYGLVGAGRSELARAIIGDGRVTAGRVIVRGRPASIGSVHEALARYRIGYVSEDRKQEGLILSQSVSRNITITVWRRIANALGLIGRRAEGKIARPLVGQLAIKGAALDSPVATLSGGNQQKVSIAKWLAADTDILIIDEPTVGIDVKTKASLHEMIVAIAARGVAVLLISSDMAEMVALADRVLVMHDFRIVGEVANDHHYETVSKAIMARIHAVEGVRTAPIGSPPR